MKIKRGLIQIVVALVLTTIILLQPVVETENVQNPDSGIEQICNDIDNIDIR